MEELNGAVIFWLLTIGLLVGLIIKLIMGKRGLSLTGNVVFGAVGSILIGALSLKLELPGSMILGFVGCISVLFLTNVFSSHPQDVHDRSATRDY